MARQPTFTPARKLFLLVVAPVAFLVTVAAIHFGPNAVLVNGHLDKDGHVVVTESLPTSTHDGRG